MKLFIIFLSLHSVWGVHAVASDFRAANDNNCSGLLVEVDAVAIDPSVLARLKTVNLDEVGLIRILNKGPLVTKEDPFGDIYLKYVYFRIPSNPFIYEVMVKMMSIKSLIPILSLSIKDFRRVDDFDPDDFFHLVTYQSMDVNDIEHLPLEHADHFLHLGAKVLGGHSFDPEQSVIIKTTFPITRGFLSGRLCFGQLFPWEKNDVSDLKSAFANLEFEPQVLSLNDEIRLELSGTKVGVDKWFVSKLGLNRFMMIVLSDKNGAITIERHKYVDSKDYDHFLSKKQSRNLSPQ